MAANDLQPTVRKRNGRSPRPDGLWMGWIHSIELRIVLNWNLFLRPMLVDRKHKVCVDQMPFPLVISGRLARDDGMLANLLVRAFSC